MDGATPVLVRRVWRDGRGNNPWVRGPTSLRQANKDHHRFMTRDSSSSRALIRQYQAKAVRKVANP